MGYVVELIDVGEKDRLYEAFESRFLYTRKVEVYGCCIKLLTEVEDVKERLEDNFYSMSENVRSHGRLIVLEEPGKECRLSMILTLRLLSSSTLTIMGG